jgi:hypothetical protein
MSPLAAPGSSLLSIRSAALSIESQGCWMDAVARSRRTGPILEGMTEVPIALGTTNLDARHSL